MMQQEIHESTAHLLLTFTCNRRGSVGSISTEDELSKTSTSNFKLLDQGTIFLYFIVAKRRIYV